MALYDLQREDLNLDYGQRPVAAKLRFDWNVNVEDQKRAAKIAFKFTDNDGNPQETVVTVSKKQLLPLRTTVQETHWHC